MEREGAIEYIHNRIWLHQEAQVRYDLETIEHDRFMPCADDERWKKEDIGGKEEGPEEGHARF